MEQTNLRRRRTSARLAFADHVDRFVAGQRSPGSPKRTKTLTGVNPSLDGPVVLPQDIVEVRHRPVLAAGVQRSFALELSDHGRVSRMPIGVDDTRRGMVLLTQGFGQEALCSRPRSALPRAGSRGWRRRSQEPDKDNATGL